MELIVFLVSFFLSLSLLTESIGVWARVQGAYNNEPTTGYSTHVRIATLGRFFILLSAPTLGYLVDGGIEQNKIALIGGCTFLIVFFTIILFLKFGMNSFGEVYRIINKKSNIKSVNVNLNLIEQFTIDKKLFIWVFLSFMLTGTGVIFVNYLATTFPDLRAMIVQMSAVITMFGTLIHVFLIDPKLSKAADEEKELLVKYVLSFLYSRAISSAILMLSFFLLYWL